MLPVRSGRVTHLAGVVGGCLIRLWEMVLSLRQVGQRGRSELLTLAGGPWPLALYLSGLTVKALISGTWDSWECGREAGPPWHWVQLRLLEASGDVVPYARSGLF